MRMVALRPSVAVVRQPMPLNRHNAPMPRSRPESASPARIVRLRIVLQEVEPPVWRRIEVPATITLIQLSEVLLVTMGWIGYHLYEYRFDGQAYGDPDPEYDRSDLKDIRRVRLERVLPKAGGMFEFRYDFGDGWRHDITVEAIEPRQRRVIYPRVIDGERACPPEDVGGPWGYANFLAAIADTTHESHEEMLDWVGGEFDPDWFDLEGVNEYFEFASR